MLTKSLTVHLANNMLCHIKVNSNTIELTVHSYYCVTDLLCVKWYKDWVYLYDKYKIICKKNTICWRSPLDQCSQKINGEEWMKDFCELKKTTFVNYHHKIVTALLLRVESVKWLIFSPHHKLVSRPNNKPCFEFLLRWTNPFSTPLFPPQW